MQTKAVMNGIADSLAASDYKDPPTVLRLRERERDATSRNSILRILSEAYGAQTVFQWCSAILERVQQAEVLQQGLHESGIQIEAKEWDELDDNTLPCSEIVAGWVLRDMRERRECGCASQGWESAEQRFEQSPKIVPELSYQDASSGKALFDMWSKGQGLWLLREALSEIQKIRQSIDCIWTGGDGMNGVSSVVRRLTPL